MKAEFIRELTDGWHGRACLVKCNGNFYAVSSVTAPSTGFGTLVFQANKEGKVTNWNEVAGGRGYNREQAIEDLETKESQVAEAAS